MREKHLSNQSRNAWMMGAFVHVHLYYPRSFPSDPRLREDVSRYRSLVLASTPPSPVVFSDLVSCPTTDSLLHPAYKYTASCPHPAAGSDRPSLPPLLFLDPQSPPFHADLGLHRSCACLRVICKVVYSVFRRLLNT